MYRLYATFKLCMGNESVDHDFFERLFYKNESTVFKQRNVNV